ncbi:metalloregulator ArsR/SmtB family transcription factor [Temperatibacter marinus]|uniref:Metalloregulator ArsR/SmtB family transcription factor n=1 Tax=Temperatibacter marinus TaxID=1456591 RepID=A0AA52EG37_9PROT|nr:metalloregulator ArsR/SmtB family transcription factor [Temperatibacter marinus]WND01436.1 metalloregulator ArsR/SmtB family transcription factor [Temperatibacter marinus]
MDRLSATFSALADPTRRAILEQLQSGKHTVASLAAPHSMSAPAISRHLKVLEKAELIHRERNAQTIYCSINGKNLKTAIDWLETYGEFWRSSFDRLENLLIQQETKKD